MCVIDFRVQNPEVRLGIACGPRPSRDTLSGEIGSATLATTIDGSSAAPGGTPDWRRWSWAAGILFVVALLAEAAISAAIPLNQDDPAAKIATELAAHRHVAVAVACISIVYAVAFLVYLVRLHGLFRERAPEATRLSTLVLVGGVLFLTLHAVSDIAIMGMLGAKVATYSSQHDQGLSYALYLTTFAVDSVGDVLGSVFVVATGLLVLRTGVLPRWLGWVAILTGVLFVLQGFGLGGVIAVFGLILDLIGFVLLLTFVGVSSIMLLRRST
jgi:hypothetical protein